MMYSLLLVGCYKTGTKVSLLKERVESLERIISNHEQENRQRRRLELMDKVALAKATRSWW